MRRYNKQQVMRDAHRLYGSEFHRRGRSWSDCLKAAWIWEHDAVRAREEKAAKLDAMIAASWIAHKEGANQRNYHTQSIETSDILCPYTIFVLRITLNSILYSHLLHYCSSNS